MRKLEGALKAIQRGSQYARSTARRGAGAVSRWLKSNVDAWEAELDDEGRFFVVLNEDPLSQLARQERRRLLLVSAITVTIVATGLLPTKIAAIGVEFSSSDRQALLYVFAAVVLYYLLAFSIYAATDLLKWIISMMAVMVGSDKPVNVGDKRVEIHQTRSGWLFDVVSWPLAFMKGLFDFLLPIVVALFAAAAAVAGVIPYKTRLIGWLRVATAELSRLIVKHQ